MNFEPYQVTIIFALLAFIAAALIWRGLRALHRDDSVNFDLRDLLMENGRVSKAAAVMLGSFAVTSWHFIYYTLNGKMTEGYAIIYVGAWITPVVARLISRGEQNNNPAPQQVVTETKTTVSG